MKILVTGGAGFIGSNITDALLDAGHKVVIIDNLSSGNMKNVNKRAMFYKLDIRDKNKLSKVFKKEKIDIIDHHAAQIDVRKSVNDPCFDAQVNILGTINLLENAKLYKVKKVIFASSGGTIYGDCGKYAPDETAQARPDSPYGIAKHTVELYLRYYSRLFGIKYTALRYGNVYGPRQDPHGEAGVVAIFSDKMLNNKKLVIFGDGEQTRDYVFVKDIVKANLSALKSGNNEVINIGTGITVSVNKLFKTMAEISNYDIKPVYKTKRPGELFKSFLNANKAKFILGWKPSVILEEGLRQTIEYFKFNRV